MDSDVVWILRAIRDVLALGVMSIIFLLIAILLRVRQIQQIQTTIDIDGKIVSTEPEAAVHRQP